MTPKAEAVGPTSAEALAALHARCFPHGWTAREIGSLLNLPGCIGLACRVDGQFVALALFRQALDEAELLTLATEPDFRRRGLADIILTSGETRLCDQGVARIFLEVSEKNPAAAALYKRAGYGEIARRKAYYRDGSDARVLEKWLRKDGQTGP
ncbi:MAG: ribosomal-protein-alanine N-acetyltransferase [Maricaulis maris]|jgi:ribosomal-protein-alanine N-acetyltransferase|uniref:GNAT family N-acetyltransferase n=1 Tax=Maricaulis sp. TaxID=1486257 RepID=UPI000C49AA7C|nr:GNAT family N-acetyltransferase [Maricaulis sp.]MAC88002.1 ribosomal-protein-alanine acetyltransferase [Maricaulis sp.]